MRRAVIMVSEAAFCWANLSRGLMAKFVVMNGDERIGSQTEINSFFFFFFNGAIV